MKSVVNIIYRKKDIFNNMFFGSTRAQMSIKIYFDNNKWAFAKIPSPCPSNKSQTCPIDQR